MSVSLKMFFELFFWILFWFKICKLISRSVENENGEGSSFENEDSSVELDQDTGTASQPCGEKAKLAKELARLGGEDVCYWVDDPNGNKRKKFTRMTLASLRYRVAEFDNDDGPALKRPRVADENNDQSGCV